MPSCPLPELHKLTIAWPSEFGLLDHVPIGACILTPELTILYWNRMLEEWSGLTREQVLGTSLSKHFPEVQMRGITSRLACIVEGGPPTIFSSQLHPHFIRNLCPNGQERVQNTTAQGIQVSGIDGICVMLIIQDVTAITTQIQKYRDARDHALSEVEERQRAEAALLNKSEELMRSNQELTQFASIASHDLQEPLRKIMTFGSRLQEKCGQQLDATGQDYLERMQKAAGRMQNLITDLLSYSRITTTRPFEQVDLTQVVQGVLSDLETLIERTGGRVDVGPLPTIDADSFQIRQLLQNLIGNGLKYHRKGEPPVVKLSAERVDTVQHGRELHVEAYWQLTIEDNGIGFDEQYSDRIFEMFQRLHGKGEYEGTGVGLAICKKIVSRHSGTIDTKSTPGLGSTFIVRLPLK